MVSKSQIKLITSLSQKKYRSRHGLFVVEGLKSIEEFLNSGFKLHALYALDGFFEQVPPPVRQGEDKEQLKKITFLKTPPEAIAVFCIPQHSDKVKPGLKLVLDDVRDPGNLGTIIRLCDWFGIRQLICSEHTVDCYNPKVVQATMGSLARVDLAYAKIDSYLKDVAATKYGAFMDGDNIYQKTLDKDAILVMGNEANGISREVEAMLDVRVSIPRFGQDTESLNVASATAILLSEFKRRE
ncbi:MAG: RNA methyltransferase [Cytophagaceae bacterium]|nr:RNA methyltransferase [Cytophagaceae bacterium]